MDFNKLIARVKAILLTPKTEWPVIAAEPATISGLYKGYILILVAIPAVFAFLHMSVIGMSLPLAGHVRVGAGQGLSSAVLAYVLALISVFIVALVVEALAPTFGGQKDRVQAFKTVAYAYTASWIAGIGVIIPGLGMLIAIAGGIYGIYLLYLGLPHTMKCPQEKAAGYTAVTVIIAIVLNILAAVIAASIVGAGSFMNGGVGGSAQFDEDSSLGKLEQWSNNLEAAGRKLEQAQQSGDQAAQEAAMKEMMGTMLGGDGHTAALAPERLKAFVPQSLAGLSRSRFLVERNDAMGLQISEARATYTDATGRSLDLEITDTGSARGLLALAGWAGMEGESETDSGYEKTYREAGRLVHEAWDHGSARGEYTVVLGERFTVKLDGAADSIDALKTALGELDLDGLEALKEEGAAVQ